MVSASRIFNRRTFPFVTVALNAIAAGAVWANGEHAAAMFGLGVAGLLALDIVRTEATVRLRSLEAESIRTDVVIKLKMAGSWQD